MRRALLLTCIALASFSAGRARAQSEATAAPERDTRETSLWVSAPACALSWWDSVALRAALEVELRSLGVVQVQVHPSADAPASSWARLRLDVDGECGRSAALRAALEDGAGSASRVVQLDDVPEASRMRALAMALSSLLSAPRVREEAEDPGPAEVAAARLSASLGDPSAPAPVATAAPEPPSEPAPSEPTAPLVGVDIAGAFAYAPASATPWGGPHAALQLYLAPPLQVALALDVLFTTAADALGEVRGTWLSGSLGVGAEASLAPLRLGARAALGVGWARLEGVARDTGVRADTSDDAVISIDIALRGALDLSSNFAVVLEADTRVILLGLVARSPSGTVVAIRDATLGLRLGVELRFGP